jgi:hypothetical protein
MKGRKERKEMRERRKEVKEGGKEGRDAKKERDAKGAKEGNEMKGREGRKEGRKVCDLEQTIPLLQTNIHQVQLGRFPNARVLVKDGDVRRGFLHAMHRLEHAGTPAEVRVHQLLCVRAEVPSQHSKISTARASPVRKNLSTARASSGRKHPYSKSELSKKISAQQE